MHILTDGTPIPPALNSIEYNRALQSKVTALADWDNVTEKGLMVNQAYINRITNGIDEDSIPARTTLLRLFLPIARVGFYSYAAMDVDEGGIVTYMLVACPRSSIGVPLVDVDIPLFDGLHDVIEENGVISSFQIIQ